MYRFSTQNTHTHTRFTQHRLNSSRTYTSNGIHSFFVAISFHSPRQNHTRKQKQNVQPPPPPPPPHRKTNKTNKTKNKTSPTSEYEPCVLWLVKLLYTPQAANADSRNQTPRRCFSVVDTRCPRTEEKRERVMKLNWNRVRNLGTLLARVMHARLQLSRSTPGLRDGSSEKSSSLPTAAGVLKFCIRVTQ